MPTECSPARFEFATVEGSAVVAGFDGGAITSDAGALLLGATDRPVGQVLRFAACFQEARSPKRVEHEIRTPGRPACLWHRVRLRGLGGHDQLRHDPVLTVLAGKLAARRPGGAPFAARAR